MSIQIFCYICAEKKSCQRFLLPNRLIVWFNGSFGLESIDLQAKLSMFGEFWVHVRCRSMNKGHPILTHWGPNSFTTFCHAKMCSTPMNQYRMLNVQTSAPNLIMHQLTATWKVLNAKQPTPDQSSRLNQIISLMTNSNEERTGK